MKQKQIKTNAIRLLDKQNVTYQLHTYEWSEDKYHSSLFSDKNLAKCIYKTIVAVGKTQTIYVCLIPLMSMIDLKKVAHLCQEKHVSLLPLDELEQKTGYIRGGCSPIGMKKQYATFIDEAVQELSTVIVSGGKRGIQIELSKQSLIALTQAKMASLIE